MSPHKTLFLFIAALILSLSASARQPIQSSREWDEDSIEKFTEQSGVDEEHKDPEKVGEKYEDVDEYEDTKEDKCPEPLDIYPCLCYEIYPGELALNCSGVRDELELARVFQAYFPTTAFQTLIISNNDRLRVLEEGVFGKVSFQVMRIQMGVLEKIEPGALSPSYHTLDNLNLRVNRLDSFPFQSLPEFTVLESINFSNNLFQSVPALSTPTLTWLDFSFNPIGFISANAFHDTPALESAHFRSTALTSVSAGTFTTPLGLDSVGLTFNNISTLVSGTINMHLNSGTVYLKNNSLTEVQVKAIEGMGGGDVYLENNLLPELPEDVWRPLLEDDVSLWVSGNPFTCGCDLAWLVFNSTLLGQVEFMATCADGRPFTDLNPGDYLDC